MGPGDGRQTAEDRAAFVLAGGGTKGAFEAGAILYLVEEEGIVPEVLTAASAGSVCAVVLAQARTHEEMITRARELRQDLLALTHQELVFGKQPWLAALEGTMFGRAIERMVVERTRPPVPGAERASAPTSRPARRRWLDVAAEIARSLPHLRRARRALPGRTGSVLTLDPLAAALAASGATARAGTPGATGPGGDPASAIGLAGAHADLLRGGEPGAPVGAGIAPIDRALVARPGLELRMAVVALGAGALRYVTGDGRIVAADAVTPVPGPAGGPVDLIDGVIASSSVPMIFPPRAMAGDAYVDGGVASNVPVEAAARLGATRIFAVLAVPLELPPDGTDYTRVPAPAVFLRAAGAVSFAERQRANLRPPLPPGTSVTVIDPTVDVVGPFEVSQGLMLLDMDYGWMRAADVLADVDERTRRVAAAATDRVVTARTQAWHREEQIWAAGWASGVDRSALDELKRQVRDAVYERKGLGLPTPPDAERWWSGYELHRRPRPAGLPDDPLAG